MKAKQRPSVAQTSAYSGALRAWDAGNQAEIPATGSALCVPMRAEELSAHYDLTLSHPQIDMDTFRAFDRWLGLAAAERGLSSCLIHDGIVNDAVRRLGDGRLRSGFHLDYYALWHVPEDPYALLAEAVWDQGGRTINSPERARFYTNKALAHACLQRRGLGVPHALVMPPGQLLDGHTAGIERLGLDAKTTIFIKPANGFGSRGVARVDHCTAERLQISFSEARQHDLHDSYILQRLVTCPRLGSDEGQELFAYWRLFYCLGEMVLFWWTRQDQTDGRPSYRRVTGAEIKRLGLQPVLAYGRDLADLCGLEWFSSELCLSEADEPSCHRAPGPDGRMRPIVAIDYFNDQCDVDVQSRWPGSPPDVFVKHVAERFAEAALVRKNTLPFGAAFAPIRDRAA